MWNQSKRQNVFHRRNCPLCACDILKDYFGSMEISYYCSSKEAHYIEIIGLYGEHIRILNKTFNSSEVDKIEEYLDEIGNEKYK
ncbi:hypothetical protein [Paenibacillus ferrarius]|uniref:hypothetical protein n=1 Tax=Paenibacillus ferrarius TaxID=1469647 RepID=UPI003D2D5B30